MDENIEMTDILKYIKYTTTGENIIIKISPVKD
jgi:hypothetical protein